MQLQPGMWVLMLNDMRSAHVEALQPVACASTKAELEALIRKETVDPYKTGNDHVRRPTLGDCHGSNQTWSKSFRQDGPLEWFNQPFDPQTDRHFIEYSPAPVHIPHVNEL